MHQQDGDIEVSVHHYQGNAVDDMGFELKMGSCIIPRCDSHYFKVGIVGPFVKIEGSNNMFFLTTSHLISQRLDYSRVLSGSQVMLLMYGAGKSRACGRVFAGGRRRGIAALVKIPEELVPTRETFIKAVGFTGISAINFPKYDNRDLRNLTHVIIFGRQTRTALVKLVADTKRELLYLYTYETRLFKRGEAGSAVFLVDQERLLHCIGICAGRKDKFQYVIYPIETILENLAQEIGKPLEIATFMAR